jgi:hypothetical protein
MDISSHRVKTNFFENEISCTSPETRRSGMNMLQIFWREIYWPQRGFIAQIYPPHKFGKSWIETTYHAIESPWLIWSSTMWWQTVSNCIHTELCRGTLCAVNVWRLRVEVVAREVWARKNIKFIRNVHLVKDDPEELLTMTLDKKGEAGLWFVAAAMTLTISVMVA